MNHCKVHCKNKVKNWTIIQIRIVNKKIKIKWNKTIVKKIKNWMKNQIYIKNS
jgi:hypothetical protein